MDLTKWIKIFLDSKNEPKIHDDEDSVTLTFRKPLLTREKLVDSGLYENIVFNGQKYLSAQFLTKESTSGGTKYIICNQMLLCTTRCLKIENIHSSPNIILQELSHFFELTCYLAQELGLTTIQSIDKKNHEKRKRLGGFQDKIYLKYKEIINPQTKELEKVKYQKIVRDGILTAVQKDSQFIETKKDGLVHQLLANLPCEEKAGASSMVKIRTNNTLNDNSCCYIESIKNNPTAATLAMFRKLNEETREIMESSPSNYLNEMGDLFEVFFQLLKDRQIKLQHVLRHIQTTQDKFGKLNVYVKGISLLKTKEA